MLFRCCGYFVFQIRHREQIKERFESEGGGGPRRGGRRSLQTKEAKEAAVEKKYLDIYFQEFSGNNTHCVLSKIGQW